MIGPAVDFRVLGRLVMSALQTALGAVANVRGPGQDLPTDSATLPAVQLLGFTGRHKPGIKGTLAKGEPDIHDLTVTVAIVCGEELTRTNAWALETAMSRVLIALAHETLIEAGASPTHRIEFRSGEYAAAEDADENQRIRMATVRFAAVATRTALQTLET